MAAELPVGARGLARVETRERTDKITIQQQCIPSQIKMAIDDQFHARKNADVVLKDHAALMCFAL